MHGRLKVKTTAQQEAERKAERASKVVQYKAAMSAIFALRGEASSSSGPNLLRMTSGVLMSNPDISTLWNIRREVILEMEDEVAEAALSSDVDLTQQCLMANPKSYGAWHHRCWCLSRMKEPDWKKELAVCAKYLSLDERNFHCWDYRRFVASAAGASPSAELDFTRDRIDANFSNYSAWHYRSKLLPGTHPPATESPSGIGISEEKRREEIDLVQNAAFTDPEDSSAWFYHTWLLGQEQAGKESPPLLALLSRRGRLHVVLSRPLARRDLRVRVNGEDAEITPSVASGGATATSKLWEVAGCQEGDSVSVAACGQQQVLEGGRSGEAVAEGTDLTWGKSADEETAKVLRQDLQNCRDLLELEPDSKWTRLSLILVMQALDEKEHRQEMLQCLEKLAEVDPMRKNYYRDWLSRLLFADRTRTLPSADSDPDLLRDLRLTHLHSPERLAKVKKLDLSGNSFRSASFLPYLVSCESLRLDAALKTDADKMLDSLPPHLKANVEYAREIENDTAI